MIREPMGVYVIHMTRAHSIFILRDVYYRHTKGGWTVKHELVTWVKENIPHARLQHYEVVRLRDGKADHETLVSWEELL